MRKMLSWASLRARLIALRVGSPAGLTGQPDPRPAGQIIRKPQQLDTFLVFRIFLHRLFQILDCLRVIGFLVISRAELMRQSRRFRVPSRNLLQVRQCLVELSLLREFL